MQINYLKDHIHKLFDQQFNSMPETRLLLCTNIYAFLSAPSGHQMNELLEFFSTVTAFKCLDVSLRNTLNSITCICGCFRYIFPLMHSPSPSEKNWCTRRNYRKTTSLNVFFFIIILAPFGMRLKAKELLQLHSFILAPSPTQLGLSGEKNGKI